MQCVEGSLTAIMINKTCLWRTMSNAFGSNWNRKVYNLLLSCAMCKLPLSTPSICIAAILLMYLQDIIVGEVLYHISMSHM